MTMKKNILRWGGLMLVVGGLILGLVVPIASAETLDRWGGPSNGSTGSVGGYLSTAPVVAPLDAAEQAALNEAILEEYGALNLYNAVLDQYGNVLPFSRIARAEAQHVRALTQLFTKYGLSVPANPGLTQAPTVTSLTQACQAGVDAEIADAALYDELLKVTDNPDVVQVYHNLQAASLNNHLLAFEACN
jgi:hypothetical protein